jgi:hypothetical protein
MKEEIKSKEELRIRAMELFKNNWSVTQICKTLDCSRNWFSGMVYGVFTRANT